MAVKELTVRGHKDGTVTVSSGTYKESTDVVGLGAFDAYESVKTHVITAGFSLPDNELEDLIVPEIRRAQGIGNGEVQKEVKEVKEKVSRGNRSPSQKGNQAYRNAVARLIDLHPSQFQNIHEEERIAFGLPANPEQARLQKRLERLQRELKDIEAKLNK